MKISIQFFTNLSKLIPYKRYNNKNLTYLKRIARHFYTEKRKLDRREDTHMTCHSNQFIFGQCPTRRSAILGNIRTQLGGSRRFVCARGSMLSTPFNIKFDSNKLFRKHFFLSFESFVTKFLNVLTAFKTLS